MRGVASALAPLPVRYVVIAPRSARGTMRPPFSFVLSKENAPRPVEKKTACAAKWRLRRWRQIRGSGKETFAKDFSFRVGREQSVCVVGTPVPHESELQNRAKTDPAAPLSAAAAPLSAAAAPLSAAAAPPVRSALPFLLGVGNPNERGSKCSCAAAGALCCDCADARRGGRCAPHFLLSCQKKMRRARWKRKPLVPPNGASAVGGKYGGPGKRHSQKISVSALGVSKVFALSVLRCRTNRNCKIGQNLTCPASLSAAAAPPVRSALPFLLGVGNPKGKQAKRRRWRIKRACFEEAARLAATKWPGIEMPRRCSGAHPLPFVSLGGVGAKSKRPHVSGGGLGEVSFRKRHLPQAFSHR